MLKGSHYSQELVIFRETDSLDSNLRNEIF